MPSLRVLLPAGFALVVMCFAALPAFEIFPLETVSETSSNASIGDLNGDGHPDIVLVKGRHWQLTTKLFFGDGKGNFAAGPELPSNATKSYSGSLADMTKSGHLDIVLSNDRPDPKLVLLNDGTGHFKVGGTYGEPKWPTRNAAVGDLNGDGYPDIAVANRGTTSYICYNDGKVHFQCKPLRNTPSAASILIADMDGDGLNDVIFPAATIARAAYFSTTIWRVKGGLGGRQVHRSERWLWPTWMATVIPTSPPVPKGLAALSTSMTAKGTSARASGSRSQERCPIR
jgi:hypothetical protein